MFTRIVAVIVLAGLLGTLVPASFAGAQDETDRVAQARQKCLVRFSLIRGASTGEIRRLSSPAATFLNLYMDLARNRKALRAKAKADSQSVVNLPYLQMTSAENALLFRVLYQDLELAGVSLPKSDLQDLLAVCLNEESIEKVAVEQESHFEVRMYRLLMFGELLRLTANLRASEPVIADAFEVNVLAIRRIAEDGVVDWIAEERLPAFEIIKQVGNAETVRKLAERLKKEAKDLSTTDRARLIGAICNIPCPAAEKFLLEILDGKNDARKARALRTLRRFPGDETGKRLAEILGPETKAARKVQGGALRALEQIPDERALKILRDVFHASKEGQRRDKIGMALARRGDAEGLSYIMSRFDVMKDDGRKFRFACDMAQAGQRWVAPYLRKKVELAKAGKNEKVKAMLPLVRALLKRLEGPGAVK